MNGTKRKGRRKVKKKVGAPLTSIERERLQKEKEKRRLQRRQQKIKEKVQESAMNLEDDVTLSCIEELFGKKVAKTTSVFAGKRSPPVAYLRKHQEEHAARRAGMVRNLLEVFQGSEEREAMVSKIVESDKDKLIENPSLERYWDLLRATIKSMAKQRLAKREHKAALRQQSVVNRKRAAAKEAESQRETKSFAGLYNNQNRFNSRQAVILRRNMDNSRFHNRIAIASEDKVETVYTRPDPMEDYKRKVINHDFSNPSSTLMDQHHQPIPHDISESSEKIKVFQPYHDSEETSEKHAAPSSLIAEFQRMVTSSDLKKGRASKKKTFTRQTQLVDPQTGLDIRTGLPPQEDFMVTFKENAKRVKQVSLTIQDGLMPSMDPSFVAK